MNSGLPVVMVKVVASLDRATMAPQSNWNCDDVALHDGRHSDGTSHEFMHPVREKWKNRLQINEAIAIWRKSSFGRTTWPRRFWRA
ncbi:hypothetical protein [Bradyrhizobium sp.]|uniref:hypothetical protein n=1 Tax=Bradyrhizobium sp. TaxID=376 RepID=UPI003C6AE7FF